jgi:uncharacterized cupredoxin-like copper-binding protein
MHRVTLVAAFALTAIVSNAGYAAKTQILDPAAHGLIRLEPLMLGSETDSSHMAPKEYRLKVGQGYRLKIKASDQSEYAFTAPAFFRNIWIRKIEVGSERVEVKTPTLDEIEFESGGEAELFFVTVRPGTYDFGSRGLMERGLVGKFIVESGDDEAGEAAASSPDEDHNAAN